MLHVVTGAPCAGKTTYIAQHKKDGDIVIDLDAIAVSLGAKSSHEYGENIMRVALAARKAAIGEIGESDAWVIHTQPTKAQRDGYKDAVFHDLDPGWKSASGVQKTMAGQMARWTRLDTGTGNQSRETLFL